jgi:hypothetical protein
VALWIELVSPSRNVVEVRYQAGTSHQSSRQTSRGVGNIQFSGTFLGIAYYSYYSLGHDVRSD